jgi:hypothetical protein
MRRQLLLKRAIKYPRLFYLILLDPFYLNFQGHYIITFIPLTYIK